MEELAYEMELEIWGGIWEKWSEVEWNMEREDEWNEGIGEKLLVCDRVGRKVRIKKIESIETWKKEMGN